MPAPSPVACSPPSGRSSGQPGQHAAQPRGCPGDHGGGYTIGLCCRYRAPSERTVPIVCGRASKLPQCRGLKLADTLAADAKFGGKAVVGTPGLGEGARCEDQPSPLLEFIDQVLGQPEQVAVGKRRPVFAGGGPLDQQRPMASVRRADWPNRARPMMLWPEARRSPSAGIAGATPTPSADTHATARPAAASSRRYRNRRRLSRVKRDSAHVVVTTGRRPRAPGRRRRAAHRRRHLAAAAEGPSPPAPSPLRAWRPAPADPATGRRATTGRHPRRSRRPDRGRRRPGRRPQASLAPGWAGLPRSKTTAAREMTGRPAIVRCCT